MTRVLAIWTTLAVLCASTACTTVDKLETDTLDRSGSITAEWVKLNAKAKHDEYRQSVSLRGPSFEEQLSDEGEYFRVHLRAVLAANGAERYQIYVATHLTGAWRNFRDAYDQEGIRLRVSKISRKKQCGEAEEGCVFYEHFGMAISGDYLRARTRKGMDVLVKAPGGDMAVWIPPAYVQGFVDAVQAERAKQANATAPKKASRVSYCESKFGSDPQALAFCQKQARASYGRLKPALDRSRSDSFTTEAKSLDVCMRQHNGRLGIDWMMVEHCFGTGPAAR
jgi:hypothetical protein